MQHSPEWSEGDGKADPEMDPIHVWKAENDHSQSLPKELVPDGWPDRQQSSPEADKPLPPPLPGELTYNPKVTRQKPQLEVRAVSGRLMFPNIGYGFYSAQRTELQAVIWI